MSKGNLYQEQINEKSFVGKLKQDDQDAWAILLEYVRKQVTYEFKSRPCPRDLTYDETLEEFTAEACSVILLRLNSYRGEGPLSAFLDALIRRSFTDRSLKNLLQAVTRFLKVVNRLSTAQQLELQGIIQQEQLNSSQRAGQECELLLACIAGKDLNLFDSKRRHLWYTARYELAHERNFQCFLYKLMTEGVSQAKTVLIWYEALKGFEEFSAESLAITDINNMEKSTTTGYVGMSHSSRNKRTMEDEMEKMEWRQLLLECLNTLRQKAQRQYQAIIYRYLHDESYSQITTVMKANRKATVRKWVSRGLKSLRVCLGKKQEEWI